MNGETKKGIRTRQGEGIHLCNDTVMDAKVWGKNKNKHIRTEKSGKRVPCYLFKCMDQTQTYHRNT